jgi:hypothetical protein
MLKNEYRFSTLVFAVCSLVFYMSVAVASEPQTPIVDRVFDAKKEQKIKQISGYSSADAFEELKDIEFLVEEDLLNKAIYKTFNHRKEEGLALSLQKLDLPKRDFVNSKNVTRTKDVYLAKKIVEAFPDESTPILLDLYRKSDATTKGNIIRVSGRVAGEIPRNILIHALDDKTVCDQEDPEVDGPPLRICDLAYNQLVLRYRIRNVLRAIGPAYRIETREYHIAILRGKL